MLCALLAAACAAPAADNCRTGVCPAPKPEPAGFLPSGKLALGANYWASHAATQMWRKWDAAAVEKDLATLAANGFTILRVFPNWADFQPIVAVPLAGGNWDKTYETRMFLSEEPRPDTPCGHAGVDERMVEHFEEFCDIAEKHGLKLIVPLLTGQMTFRNFVPPALIHLDLYSDPYALTWEGRYLECMVARLKAKPAIAAWESGNEARILAKCENRYQAEFWQRYVHDIIRQADPSRPVIGVDGLELTERLAWPTSVNARLSDYVTTHPYAMWGQQYNDDFNGIRNAFFCAAQTMALAQVAGKPAFVEEHGARRQEQTNPDNIAAYIRGMCWNLWEADCRAMLWWCAFDQTGQDIAPYDWRQPCVELGIFKRDRTPYPGVKSIADFAAFQKSLPFEALPKPVPNAMFIVSNPQVVHSSYIIARQAGIMPAYQSAEQPLRDAKTYFLPSANGRAFLSLRMWEALKAKVRAGATLYLSWDDTFLDEMEAVGGICVARREGKWTTADCKFADFSVRMGNPVDVTFKTLGAEVLAKDQHGRGVFFKNRYGKGTVYVFAYPFEKTFYGTAGKYASDAYRIYQIVRPVTRLLRTGSRDVTVSEHCFGGGRCGVVVVNNGETPYSAVPELLPKWHVVRSYTDAPALAGWADGKLSLAPNSGILLWMEKEKAK